MPASRRQAHTWARPGPSVARESINAVSFTPTGQHAHGRQARAGVGTKEMGQALATGPEREPRVRRGDVQVSAARGDSIGVSLALDLRGSVTSTTFFVPSDFAAFAGLQAANAACIARLAQGCIAGTGLERAFGGSVVLHSSRSSIGFVFEHLAAGRRKVRGFVSALALRYSVSQAMTATVRPSTLKPQPRNMRLACTSPKLPISSNSSW